MSIILVTTVFLWFGQEFNDSKACKLACCEAEVLFLFLLSFVSKMHYDCYKIIDAAYYYLSKNIDIVVISSSSRMMMMMMMMMMMQVSRYSVIVVECYSSFTGM